MSSKAGAILKALPGFKVLGKDQFMAQCPAHDDKKASLSVNIQSDGRILITCHAGCETVDILENLDLTMADLMPDRKEIGRHDPVATYDYVDLNGDLLYQVCRFEPKDFRQRRMNGNGDWTWNVKGIRRVPYRLLELVENDYIYIVEGEKDVENLRKIGLTATCNAGGAGKWPLDLNQYFNKNHHVTIIPDNDEPGRKHAELVAYNLKKIVADIKILILPDLPEKGDVSDWLQKIRPDEAADEIIKLTDATEKYDTNIIISETGRNISGEVRDFVGSIEGKFTTKDMYSELGIFDAKDRIAARQTLMRMKGKEIERDGNHSGHWRIIRSVVKEMDFTNLNTDELDLWLPLDLHNYVSIMPGNVIVIAGDPDAGKTAFLLNVIKRNIDRWSCHYFNSEMGPEELYKRIQLFNDFPFHHKNFHAYERADDFQDVLRTGKYSLNIIDFLEITDEFYKVATFISQIHRALGEGIAIIAIQKRSRNDDLPLGGARALEKPRLVVALKSGNKYDPNRATILKCKNRKTDHSMIGMSREYKLVQGSEFFCHKSTWI